MKLPEPALWHDAETSHWKKLSKPERPTYEAYYTEAQCKQIQRDALEAAAKVCSDECMNWDFDKPLLHAESKILKLMEGV
jgi:hypothetical protein